jgi:hypothetical protein
MQTRNAAKMTPTQEAGYRQTVSLVHALGWKETLLNLAELAQRNSIVDRTLGNRDGLDKNNLRDTLLQLAGE